MKNVLFTFLALFLFSIAHAQLTIKAPNGNVGVGTDTPIQKLDVTGNVRTQGNILLDSPGLQHGVIGSSGSQRMIMSTAPSTSSSLAYFSMFGEENLAGAVPSRAGEFTLAGSYVQIRTGVTNGSFGTPAMNIFSDQTVTFNTSTTRKLGNSNWTVVSDRRLKNDIRPFEGGLENILNINPVWYSYNGQANTDSSREFVGMIAQEYQKIAPYDVEEINNKNIENGNAEKYLGLNDSAIKYMLVNAVKEQNKTILDQEDRINELEEKINYLLTSRNEVESNNSEQNYSIGSIKLLSPNPSSGIFNIQYSIPENTVNAEIIVYSLSGQEVFHNKIPLDIRNSNSKIDISNASNGIYTVALIVNNEIAESQNIMIKK